MKRIVSDIHNAVQNSRKTIEFLNQNSAWTWIGEYPIAVLNEITRVKDSQTLEHLDKINFFNDKGFSEHTYTQEQINNLQQNTPNAIKSAYCLCLKKPQTQSYNFQEKFEHDCWKKVTDDGNFEAFVENSKFNDEDTSKTIETRLRDIMRSSKEIPSLKRIGFVWIVTLPKTTFIEDILEHYFLDNHVYIEKGRKISYIAWAESLAEVNMRYFVNKP